MNVYPGKNYLIILRFFFILVSSILFIILFSVTLFFPFIWLPLLILWFIATIFLCAVYPGLYFKKLKYTITKTQITVTSGVIYATTKTVNRADLYTVSRQTNPVLSLAGLYHLKFYGSGGSLTLWGLKKR